MGMLDGFKILSLNHFLLGPLAAQILADLGAEVISVEPVGGSFSRKWAGGDIWVGDVSVFYLCAHRNKKSIVIDLKSPEGLEVARKLVATSDVLMENFRPGVLDRIGLGYEETRKINPKLIYASGSGWGSTGPYAFKPGQDLLMQALSGLAYSTGGDRPTPVGSSIVDHHGAMIMASAIMASLLGRYKDGKGRRVDVDLMSAALDLQSEGLVAYFNGGEGRSIRPEGHVSGWSQPSPYGIYQAQDGFVALSLGPMEKMARVFGDDRMLAFTEKDSWMRKEHVSDVFAEDVAKMTMDDILTAFDKEGLWAAPVNDFATVAVDPQVKHLNVFEEATLASGQKVTLVRHPATYDGVRPGTRIAPPSPGADTDNIMQALGYSNEEVSHLRRLGSIG